MKALPFGSSSAAGDAAQDLRTRADRLAALDDPVEEGPWRISFSDPGAAFETIRPRIAEATAGGDRCIYVFTLTDESAAPMIRSAMEEISRTRKSGEETPWSGRRIAQHNAGVPDGMVLYVGSSYATGTRKGTLATRLAQHLGLSGGATYAMHLAQWARHLPGGVDVSVLQYPLEILREDLLAIEDHLSSKLGPMLGRRGSAR